jgi:hypothetical protein
MNRFKILSEQEVQKLHSTSLDVLDTIGLRVHSEKVRKMLEEAGARVDHKTMLVHFPPNLVEESINKAPERVIYGARNPKYDLVLEPGGGTFCRPVIGAKGYDIRVNAIYPGYIYTPMMEQEARDWGLTLEQYKARVAEKYCPIGHVGEPIDIAYAVLYLASDESKFTTGADMIVDGGISAK